MGKSKSYRTRNAANRALRITFPYGYGGALMLDDRFSTTLPDDLPQQMSMHTGGKLLFYGQTGEKITLSGMSVTLETNPYSFEGYYFLTDMPSSAPLPDCIPYSTAEKYADTHTAAYVINRDIQNFVQMGERWFDRTIENDSPTHYSFPITDRSADTPSIRLTYAWGSDENATIDLGLPEYTSKNIESGLSISNVSVFTRRTGYTEFTLGNDATEDTLHLNVLLTQPRPTGSNIGMDFMAISYPRLNTLGQDPQRTLYFTSNYDTNVRFSDIPAGTCAWDISSASSVRPYEMIDNQITLTASTPTVILFDPQAQQHTPEIVDRDLVNQNLHALTVPTMLIVTTPNLLIQAEELAEIHRSIQGIDVAVVNAEDIYNEFSSGSFSAMGLRRFVKMLYDREPSKLRSLLLYGAASYDMRHITHSMPILPVRECSQDLYMYSTVQSYCTDSYFGMLNDNYNPNLIWHQYTQIAVGRLPVHTPELASMVNDKIRRFMTTPHWMRAANKSIYIADNVDDAQYTEAIDQIATTISTRPGSLTHKNYVDFFPNDYTNPLPQLNRSVANHIHEGVGFVHYIGHSNYEGFVTGKYGITSQAATGFSNETMPISILSTCNLGHFDGTLEAFAISSLLSKNAMIANIAYSRESWAKGNETSHKIIAKHIASATSGTTLGQLWLEMQSDCIKENITSTRYSINDLNRNLLGDPELPLHFADYEASINLTDNLSELPTLTPVRITGQIIDKTGSVASDFNGKIDLTVTIEHITTTTRGIRDANSGGKTYLCGSIPVAKVTAEITEGNYETTLILPQQPKSAKLRIVAYAETPDYTYSATGELKNITVSDAETSRITDTTPPSITYFYVGTPDNRVSSPDAAIHACIHDDISGIATCPSPLEIAMHADIDGNEIDNARSYCRIDTDGSAYFDIPVGSLPDGSHTVTISLCDNSGNRIVKSVDFEVMSAEMSISLQCLTKINRDNALFEWTHNYLSTDPTVNIIIFDKCGNTVANILQPSSSSQWEWNLLDQNGNPVENGTYTASAMATDGLRYASSPEITFIVLR